MLDLVTVRDVSKKPVAKKRSVAKTKRKIKNKSPSLGRPKVTGDEKLYMLFKEDYHAPQIFEFQRVESVRELELCDRLEPERAQTGLGRAIMDRLRRAASR